MAVPAKLLCRAAKLRAEIEAHNHAYYVLDSPTISDAEFDQLFRELEALERDYPELVSPDSPTQRVSGEPAAEFAAVTHKVPMLSLSNALTEQEAEAFDRRVRDGLGVQQVEYTVEPNWIGKSQTSAARQGAKTHALKDLKR